MTWIIWLILAAVLGVVELLTVTLTLGLIAVAAAVAAVVGALGVPVPLQILAFVLAAGGAGPGPARRQAPPQAAPGAAHRDSRAGRPKCPGPAGSQRHGGRVRIGGELWSARSYDETQVIPVGSTVDVFAIEGATALVHPRE